ncbi:MAG: hypothetical protein JWN14_1275 [Chthonomonadales bacterium]|nr:hypothetical protein [Chthonomonadales bacterium]
MDDRESALTTAFYLRTFMLDLRSTEPLHQRRFAASVLRDYADARTLRALIDTVDDEDEELRRTASEGVEAILNVGDPLEELSPSVASEAMDRVSQVYEKRREPALLRLIVAALASQHAGFAGSTRNILRAFSCENLLQLAREPEHPLAAEAWNALRLQYQQLQPATIQLFIDLALGSEGAALARSACDLLVELPKLLPFTDCIQLFKLMGSENEVVAELGWAGLEGLLARSDVPSEVYSEARLWVRDHFTEWVRICSVEDPVRKQVLATLRKHSRFTERPGLQELRICAQLTHNPGRIADTAWNILTKTFHEEYSWRVSSENEEMDIFWAIQTVMELAVGQIPGNQDAATDLLLQNPSCLHTISNADLLAKVTCFESGKLTEAAWQRLKHLFDAEKIRPDNEMWKAVITESDPRMIPAFLLLLGLKHQNSDAEEIAWQTVLSTQNAAVPEMLVQLLSHERQSVQERAFEALCSRKDRLDLLLKLLTYACNNSRLQRVVEQYGREACWDTMFDEFTRFASVRAFQYVRGEVFPASGRASAEPPYPSCGSMRPMPLFFPRVLDGGRSRSNREMGCVRCDRYLVRIYILSKDDAYATTRACS